MTLPVLTLLIAGKTLMDLAYSRGRRQFPSVWARTC